MANPTKWKPMIRDLLYQELVERFGPYNTWDKSKRTVPTGKEKEYHKFCEDFAKIVEILSGIKTTRIAVETQVSWCFTPQEQITSKGYVQQYITNLASAYKSGFIENKDLPETILKES